MVCEKCGGFKWWTRKGVEVSSGREGGFLLEERGDFTLRNVLQVFALSHMEPYRQFWNRI